MILLARSDLQTFAGSLLEFALELADSSPETADTTTDFMRVGRLPILKGTKRQFSGQMSQIFKSVKTIDIQPVRQTEVLW